MKAIEQLQRSAARADQRDAARRLRIAALAQQSRWVEAEQAARQEIKLSQPADLFPLVRLLDRSAAEAESDLKTRRIGYLLQILLSRVLEDPDALPLEIRSEAPLRTIRGVLLFSAATDRGRAPGRGHDTVGIPSVT